MYCYKLSQQQKETQRANSEDRESKEQREGEKRALWLRLSLIKWP